MKNANDEFAERGIQRTAAEIRAKYARNCIDTDSPLFRWLWGLLLSKDLQDGDKVTGLALALHFSKKGGEAWPSLHTLTAIRRKGRATIRRHIEALVGHHFIAKASGGGRGNESRYRMRPVPQATLNELAGALEKGGTDAAHSTEKGSVSEPVSEEVKGPFVNGKGSICERERGPFVNKKGSTGEPRTVYGTVHLNTHPIDPKASGPESSRGGVCEERQFPWEEGQKQADHNVVDFATKRHGSASPRPAEPSGPDAGLAKEDDRDLFDTILNSKLFHTNTNPVHARRAFMQLPPEDRQLAAEAVPHMAKAKKVEAAGLKRSAHDHRQYTPKLENWLKNRGFENFAADVQKHRAERVPGFPPGVQRPEVRNRVNHYLAVKREHPDDAKWMRFIFDPADNRTGLSHYKWEERQREKLEGGSPDAVQPIADLGPAPDDPNCILPPCIMDEFREEIASLMARAERNTAGVAGMA